MLSFSLIGAGGFVAPRHMRAIKETGNTLVSVYDIHDGLGVMDDYFPGSVCFSDIERYNRFHEKQAPDLLTVCSPNHLHFGHIAMGLGWGADVICEKPMVLDPRQLQELRKLESETGKRVYTILQLRLLEEVRALREEVGKSDEIYDVEVSYISARGNWYFNSWKGQDELSGGLVTNIGIHLFDLLLWVFGPCDTALLNHSDPRTAFGTLELARARVRWKLSVDAGELPRSVALAGERTFRQITVNGREIRLDKGLGDLHTLSYKDVLAGQGLGIDDAGPSIRLCHLLRSI